MDQQCEDYAQGPSDGMGVTHVHQYEYEWTQRIIDVQGECHGLSKKIGSN